MIKTIPVFCSTLPRKWALVGMFVSTLLLSISIEVLGRMTVTRPIEWDAISLMVANFTLILTALAFVWLASKTPIQHLINSVIMLGSLVVLLQLYPVVF